MYISYILILIKSYIFLIDFIHVFGQTVELWAHFKKCNIALQFMNHIYLLGLD